MTVRPMVRDGLNTVSPAEILASKQEFVAYKESCRKKLIDFRARKLKGKKFTTSSQLIKSRIGFAEVRLKEDRMISRILEERLATSEQTNRNIPISKVVAKIAQREMKTVETSQTL